jgi:hypothetical protein
VADGGDTEVVGDFTLSETLAVADGKSLVVRPGATLTLARGATVSGAASLVNEGSLVVEAALVLPDGLGVSNSGDVTVQAGAALTIVAADSQNSGLWMVEVGGSVGFVHGRLSNIPGGTVVNRGVVEFQGLPVVSADGLFNGGQFDNTAGLTYFDLAAVEGGGTWLGSVEHAPLFAVTLESTIDDVDCSPELKNADALGAWADYRVEDGATSLFLYPGFEFEIGAPPSCGQGSETKVFEGWWIGSDGWFPFTLNGEGNPNKETMPARVLEIKACYGFPLATAPPPPPLPTTSPTPSASPTLAPTGIDVARTAPPAVSAAVLTAVGLALTGLAAKLRRRQSHLD